MDDTRKSIQTRICDNEIADLSHNEVDSDEFDDKLGSRFQLEPDFRNPDYHQNPFMHQASDEAISGALKAAQLEKIRKRGILHSPSFVDEIIPEPAFPTHDALFTHINIIQPATVTSSSPVYVMATNGAPTTYLMEKESSESKPDLDEDLRQKVESLQITEVNGTEETDPPPPDGSNGSESERGDKSYHDWKDELPIHLKSLKFMIDVLNDRHKNPCEFASATLLDIPPPVFGEKFKKIEVIRDTWPDRAFPVPGDRIHPPINPNEVKFAERPVPLSAGCRPRMKPMDSCQFRRRTKSAEPDLSSYRNETPLRKKAQKHDSDWMGSSRLNKRQAIELHGVYVVEEISEEDEGQELELELTASASESPDSESLSIEADLNTNAFSSPLRPIHRLRRDAWNISPISEDLSESDKDSEMAGDGDGNSSVSSTNATLGDFSQSFTARLNCSSPILSHSPSLRKMTPTSTPTGPADGGNTCSFRKMKDLARALDDISDKEEEQTTTESEYTDEEKTESFEVDLAAGGDAGSSCLNNSFCKDKSSDNLKDVLMETGDGDTSGVKEDDGCNGNGSGDAVMNLKNSNQKATNVDDDKRSTGSTTVWETLSANIEAHIEVGNPAGFVTGPIDHPLQITTLDQEECPSYMYYDKPLAPIPKLPD